MKIKNIIWIFALVLCISFVHAAKDVAYVINDADVSSDVTSVLNDLNLSYDTINNNQIASTSFSNYKMLLVGDSVFSNASQIPVNQFNSLVMNTRYVSQFNIADYTRAENARNTAIVMTINQITRDLTNSPFNLYTTSFRYYNRLPLRPEIAYGLANIIATDNSKEYVILGIINPGDLLNDNSVSKKRLLYYGITDTSYWTQDSRILFRNSVIWTLKGNGSDDPPLTVSLLKPADGFVSDVSNITFGFKAVDNGANINCAFYSDVNGSFGQIGPGFSVVNNTEKDILLYNLNNGNYIWNVLCNDGTNSAFALNNRSFGVNINYPPTVQPISSITVSETDSVVINVLASDVDNDNLTYSINSSKFTVNGNQLVWLTTYGNAGVYNFIVSVSDGKFTVSTPVKVTVLFKNAPPVFTGTIGNQNTDENTNLTIDLSNYFSDPNHDNLTYSAELYTNITVLFNGNIAKIVPNKYWFGSTQLRFAANDGHGSITRSNTFTLFVNHVNQPPKLNHINNIVASEGDLIKINATASDPDGDVLLFLYSAPFDFQGKWQTNFTDAGNYTILVRVTDGFLEDNQTLNVSVLNKDIPPILDPVPNFTIMENSGKQEVWNLSATDPDGTIDRFTIVNENTNRVDCSAENVNGVWKLFLTPSQNIFGVSFCTVRVIDNSGSFDDQVIKITVVGVNQPPHIVSFFPTSNIITIDKNGMQTFIVSTSDVDGDNVAVDWFVDNIHVATGNLYTFVGQGIVKNYTIEVIANDSQLTDSHNWLLNAVEGIPIPVGNSCSNLGGNICSSNQVCNGQLLNANDTNMCCNIQCTTIIIPPPSGNNTLSNFTHLNSCSNGAVGNLDVQIDNPSEGDEFSPEDKINVKTTVDNNGDRSKEVKIEAILYDTTSNEKIESVKSDKFNVGRNDQEESELGLLVPDSDIKEDDDYILFVKAFESGKENSQCSENFVNIDIKRKKDKVVFEDLTFNPDSISCDRNLFIRASLNNVGTKTQKESYIQARIEGTNLISTSDTFTLGGFDKEDHDITKELNINIPSDIKSGNYNLDVAAFYDGKSISETRSLIISGCGQQEEIPPIKISGGTDVGVDGIFVKNKGDKLVIPVEIDNKADNFIVYNVNMEDNAVDAKSENVLLGKNQKTIVNLESKVKEDATPGQHVINVKVLSDGQIIGSKNVLINVKEPVKEGISLFGITLIIINVLIFLIIVYFIITLI